MQDRDCYNRTRRPSRRELLRLLGGSAATLSLGCELPQPAPTLPDPARLMELKPRGAIYFPARAYNAYQMWRDYSTEIADRDLAYAQTIGLNALRVWLSYEYWLEAAGSLKTALGDLLGLASARGIKIMPALFEGVGVEPAPEALVEQDPLKAYALLSPALEVVEDPSKWSQTRDYVTWMMENFRGDSRLLAIEIHNEPHTAARKRFTRAMLEHLRPLRGSVPISIGGMDLRQSMFFLDLGVDILQTHLNFPQSQDQVRQRIQRDIADAEAALGKPVWMTEWQRVRDSGTGWGDEPLAGEEWQPNYSSIAPVVREAGVGNFFWALMLKPAYLPPQRRKGTINGLFHEDGAVWSLADARAISGNDGLDLEERREWPDWAMKVPETYLR